MQISHSSEDFYNAICIAPPHVLLQNAIKWQTSPKAQWIEFANFSGLRRAYARSRSMNFAEARTAICPFCSISDSRT